ncbi:hypothetical protein RIF29_40272 [Crotalaria pallida]|uniref:Uncharacterized protein n=1 Tax=Crotalaria pallida TaxID=3830 RepID=A0AAN9E4G9_CROPI
MEQPSSPTNLEEYSPSSTLLTFDNPIPLIRGPLFDPISGSHVLAFRDTRAWAIAFRSCERKIVTQCEEGARIGCAINASSKCKPPWWKVLVGSGSKKPAEEELKERELCEEREMRECLDAAKGKCVEFARGKCLVPFRDARVKGLGLRDAARLVSFASMSERSLLATSRIGCRCLFGGGGFGTMNCRASELAGFDECVQCILGEEQQEGVEK